MNFFKIIFIKDTSHPTSKSKPCIMIMVGKWGVNSVKFEI
jgi:hypothetical protein